jgi:hypothetical protein
MGTTLRSRLSIPSAMSYLALPTARRFINVRFVEAVTIFLASLALLALFLLMCRKVTFNTV